VDKLLFFDAALALNDPMQFHQLKRREFITLLGGAGVWPFEARAQRSTPIVGFLSSRSPDESDSAVSAFRHGLGQTGYSEGKNVTIEYRWAEGHYDRLPELAAELVRRQVAVIAATGGEPSPLAAKAATSTIPIVFTAGGDPVEFGLVPSLGPPGGNVTGVTFFFASIGPKRLELVHQLRPNASTIAMLINPNYQPGPVEARDVQTGAASLGVQINGLNASTESQVDAAFTTIVQQKVEALIVGTDPFLLGRRDQLVRLASQYGIPTIYFAREFVEAGGLISYGPSITVGYRQVGTYVGRILNGEKPADMPVLQPTVFVLFINLKTAKALGLELSQTLLALADEVIE
jgi:putative ABC transport system substrate-binding protein